MTARIEGFTPGYIGVLQDETIVYFRTREAAMKACPITHYPAQVPNGAIYYEDVRRAPIVTDIYRIPLADRDAGAWAREHRAETRSILRWPGQLWERAAESAIR